MAVTPMECEQHREEINARIAHHDSTCREGRMQELREGRAIFRFWMSVCISIVFAISCTLTAFVIKIKVDTQVHEIKIESTSKVLDEIGAKIDKLESTLMKAIGDR